MLFLLVAVAGGAQTVGDSERVIEERLGRPTVTRQVGATVTAIYANGTRVVFKDGVAVDVRLKVSKTKRTESPAPVVSEPTAPSPTPVPTLPPQPTPVVVQSVAAPVEEADVAGSLNLADENATGEWIWTGVMWVGLLIYGYCKRRIVRAAWNESASWGVGVMLVPGMQFIYLSRHWDDVKPFALWMYLVGLPLACVGLVLA